jgi:hypothetical protein
MKQITIDEPTIALRRIPFVLRLAADRNEIQRINLGAMSSGSFTLTFSGQTTSSISYAADMSAAIKSALEALSNIGASNITVTKGTGQVYDVTFAGTLAATDVPVMTLTPTGFTPVGITEVQHGGVSGQPARGAVLNNTEFRVTINGAIFGNPQGVISEVGHGLYYYTADLAEVAQRGFLACVVLRPDLSVTYGVADIISSTGSTGAVIRTFTAVAADANSVTADAGASTVTNFYRGASVYVKSGTGTGQKRTIHASNGITKVLSIDPPWAQMLDTSSVCDIEPEATSTADLTKAYWNRVGSIAGDMAEVSDVADHILTAASSNPIKSDLAEINNTPVTGDGSAGNKWRKA